MAQRTITYRTDDLDGTEGAETICFALEGIEYEIDLNDKNAEKLRKALTLYIDAGRKVGGRRSARRPGPSSSNGSVDTAAIRAWARANGIAVSERGRLPQTLRDQYAAAN